jgi:predicted PurR-regulated permease PerM
MPEERRELETTDLRRSSPRRAGLLLEGTHHTMRTAAGALVSWSKAVVIEGLCVAVLWWIGLALLHVPLAPLWAILAGLCSLIPNFGGVLSVIGPVVSVLVSGGDLANLGLVLGLYAAIVIIDQLLIQPLLLHKVTRVPVWASILAPIVLGVVIPFWGVLLAPPLLAVGYALKRSRHAAQAG